MTSVLNLSELDLVAVLIRQASVTNLHLRFLRIPHGRSGRVNEDWLHHLESIKCVMVRTESGVEVSYQAVKHNTETDEIFILERTTQELREAHLIGLQADDRTPTRVIEAEEWRYCREGES